MKGILLASWIAAYGADAATTHHALNHGAREVVLTQNPWANDAIIGGQAIACWYLTRRFENGHPRLIKGLRIATVAVRGYVAVHNARQVR